jgi:nucleotide-binding universal stress UspA family protein
MMFRPILIAYDGSMGAEKALQAALAMAKPLDADLHLVAVEEGLPRYAATADELDAVKEQKDDYYRELCARAELDAEFAGVRLTTHLVVGHPSSRIPELARELECDLIVVGFRGQSALHDRIFGSTCSGIVLRSDCSVLVVK